MQILRAVHRYVTVLIVVFTLFLGVTGTTIQLIDLRTIVSGSPAADPNTRAMRESFDGPGGYAVRDTPDYDAAALPATFDYPNGFDRVISAARAALGDVPLTYVEFRMSDAGPVGRVGVDKGHVAFDPLSGAQVEKTAVDVRDADQPISQRNTVKQLHRMTSFGDWALYINVVVSLGLAVLIVTGLIVYFQLLAGRMRTGRKQLIWSGGGVWRSLHRAISVLAAAVLIVVTLSGAWLAVESLGMGFYLAKQAAQRQAEQDGAPPRPRINPIAPLSDVALPTMLRVTLEAARTAAPDAAIKVVRLRNYAGYPQGVIVTGGADSRQLVFNASTGRTMSETEPGYPVVGFPFGWQAHQTAKNVHRGDFIGLPGRALDLFAGLAMIYLSISGIVMYADMWRKRATKGRRALLWI